MFVCVSDTSVFIPCVVLIHNINIAFVVMTNKSKVEPRPEGKVNDQKYPKQTGHVVLCYENECPNVLVHETDWRENNSMVVYYNLLNLR